MLWQGHTSRRWRGTAGRCWMSALTTPGSALQQPLPMVSEGPATAGELQHQTPLSSLWLYFECSLMKRRTWFKTIDRAMFVSLQKLGIKLWKFSPVMKFLFSYFNQLNMSFPFNFKLGKKYFTCGWKYILNVYINSFSGGWFGGSDLGFNEKCSWNFTDRFTSRLF